MVLTGAQMLHCTRQFGGEALTINVFGDFPQRRSSKLSAITFKSHQSKSLDWGKICGRSIDGDICPSPRSETYPYSQYRLLRKTHVLFACKIHISRKRLIGIDLVRHRLRELLWIFGININANFGKTLFPLVRPTGRKLNTTRPMLFAPPYGQRLVKLSIAAEQQLLGKQSDNGSLMINRRHGAHCNRMKTFWPYYGTNEQ